MLYYTSKMQMIMSWKFEKINLEHTHNMWNVTAFIYPTNHCILIQHRSRMEPGLIDGRLVTHLHHKGHLGSRNLVNKHTYFDVESISSLVIRFHLNCNKAMIVTISLKKNGEEDVDEKPNIFEKKERIKEKKQKNKWIWKHKNISQLP